MYLDVWEGGEELEIVEGGKYVMSIYYVRKSIFNKREVLKAISCSNYNNKIIDMVILLFTLHRK